MGDPVAPPVVEKTLTFLDQHCHTFKGKVPGLATVVNVDEAFFHCSKCMIRSHLWQPEHWPALEGLPTLAETMKDAASFQGPVDALARVIREDEEKRLY